MELQEQQAKSHRRFNPLTREWILVSPNRTQRPWQGQTEKAELPAAPEYDPTCYLCPGNERAGGAHNPEYLNTFVFDNDFAALQPHTGEANINGGDKNLLVAAAESGLCKVVCFSPRHDLALARLSVLEIGGVIEVWADQYRTLGELPQINHVQIFENRGAMMGCSNPHPHGQIWATQTIPNEPRKEQESLEGYLLRQGSCMLCDYARLEETSDERMVFQNELFIVVVPFWATWPFETLVLSKRHVGDIAALSTKERTALADVLKRLTIRYDNLFQAAFPYSMGFHQRPTDGKEHGEWHFHAHFFPPLLRSAWVKKFMVGFEMFGSPQRDMTPEAAAARLRDMKDEHYLSGG